MTTIKQYEKKDGTKAWLFRAHLGISPLAGKKTRIARRNFKIEKGAQIGLNRLLVNFEENGLRKKIDETFKEVYGLWYKSYKTAIKEVTRLKVEIKSSK